MTDVVWATARVRSPGEGDNFPLTCQKFIVKRNGVEVGTLKHVNRWKSAGGPAWEGRIILDSRSICGGVSFYAKDRRKVLDWFKADFDNILRTHGPRQAA